MACSAEGSSLCHLSVDFTKKRLTCDVDEHGSMLSQVFWGRFALAVGTVLADCQTKGERANLGASPQWRSEGFQL